MFIKTYYPLLFKILGHWREESERPPLLIAGIDEEEWKVIKIEVIKTFVGESFKPELLAEHPDILTLERDSGKLNIEVEKTRLFINNLLLSNFELTFRMGIINGADLLNIQSQNALLKTLEEPLKNRYLIITSASKNQLLPTILSRCAIVNLNQKTDEFISDYLNTEFPQLDSQKKKLIIRWSGGKIGKAKQIAQNFEYYEEMLNFLKKIQKFSPSQRIREAAIWSSGKPYKIMDFFDFAIQEQKHRLKESLVIDDKPDAKKISLLQEKALDYLHQLQKTSGANPKILLESFILNV